MINIKKYEIKALRLSEVNSSHRREVKPMRLSELSTDKLTPVKYQQTPTPIQPVQQSAYQNTRPAQPVRTAPPVQQPTTGYTQNTRPAEPVRTAPPVQQPSRNIPARPKLPPADKLLRKGEKYSITKNHPSAVSLRAGIGWDFSGNIAYDIDIEAFMLNDTEKVPDDSWIVFYGQLKSPDGAVIHRGDSANGQNFGIDCEQIDINLNAVNKQISKIALVMTINEAKLHGYNFSGIKYAYIRFSDVQTGKEIFRYELTDYYPEVVSMVVGELYFRNNEWRFNPVGMGTGDDLEGLCNRYGIEVK